MLNKRFEYGRRDLWLLRLIALVFSIFLWMAVIGGKKAEINKEVRIDFRLGEGLVVANQLPKEILFKIRGPRVFLKELESRDMIIPIDLQSSGTGDLEVNLTDNLLELPLGLEVVSVTPKKFKIVLDRVAKKRVTVRPVLNQKLPEGFNVTQVFANPSTIEVLGPQKNLRFINSIPTEELGLTTSPLKQEFEAKLNLSDFPGVQVTEGVENIYVVAELEGPTSKKRISNIPVALKIGTGKNARRVNPLRIGARMSPDTVTFVMEGAEDALERLSPKVLQVWVEIPSVEKGRYRTKILWSLPPGLRVLRRSTDYIEIQIR